MIEYLEKMNLNVNEASFRQALTKEITLSVYCKNIQVDEKLLSIEFEALIKQQETQELNKKKF